MQVERFVPDALDDDQRQLYDAIAGGPRAANRSVPVTEADGSLGGPFNAMLLEPKIGLPLQALGAALRFEGALEPRTRELLVLTVACRLRSSYEWQAHTRIGAGVGLTPEQIADVAAGELPADPLDRAVVQLATILLGDMDDPATATQLADCEERLGAKAVFEVSVFVGYYRMLAQQMNLFEITAPGAPWAKEGR